MPEKKPFKIHDWNAEMQEGEDIQVSFRLQGVNKPSIFVAIFQAGKRMIESAQGGGSSFMDYFAPLMSLVTLVIDALKKSK
jgi:hypothetical protein